MPAPAITRRSLIAGVATIGVSAVGIRPSAARDAGWASVGPIRIAAIHDATLTVPAAEAGFSEGSAPLSKDVMVHVLRFRGETVLVGVGVGDHGVLPRGRLIDGLAALGLQPSDIDLILLTHLHPEHVGGLVDRAGNPVFANARVVSCRTEWRWWNHNDRPAGLPERYLPFVPLARMATHPYQAAGRLITFSGTEVVSAGVTGFPALGHTAGHSLYRLEEGAGRVLTLGDAVHLPERQIANPDALLALDQNPRSAASTRRWILDQAARENLAVIGSHIAKPAVARVSRAGQGFALTAI